MNELLIKKFISKITIKDIETFSKKHKINLNENELKIIESHIKQNWHSIIYGNPKPIFDDIKEKINENNYLKIEKLYIEFKNKYKNYL